MKFEKKEDFEIFQGFNQPTENSGIIFQRNNSGSGEPLILVSSSMADSGFGGFGGATYFAPLWVEKKGKK